VEPPTKLPEAAGTVSSDALCGPSRATAPLELAVAAITLRDRTVEAHNVQNGIHLWRCRVGSDFGFRPRSSLLYWP